MKDRLLEVPFHVVINKGALSRIIDLDVYIHISHTVGGGLVELVTVGRGRVVLSRVGRQHQFRVKTNQLQSRSGHRLGMCG